MMYSNKSIFFGFVFYFLAHTSVAQVQSNISAFYKTAVFNNPSFVGSQGKGQLIMIHKSLWENIPTSINFSGLSGDASFKYGRYGAGITLITENVDPSKSIYINGNFAYKINFKRGRLSFGFRAGLTQRTEDLTGLKSKDPDILNGRYNKKSLDAGLGVLYKESNFFIGVSMIRSGSVYVNIDNKLLNNYYFISGIEKEVTNNFRISPTIQVRYVNSFPTFASFALPVTYKEFVMAGINFSTSSVLGATVGIDLYSLAGVNDKSAYLIYSWETGLGKSASVTGNSNELVLLLSFNNLDKVSAILKRKITVSPLYID